MRAKSIPIKAWKHEPAAAGVTIVFSEGLELSDNENDAEFDDAEPAVEFRHPLEGHPDIPPISQLQHAIAEVIFSSAGNDCGLQAIQNAVAKKKSLKRRDMSDYPAGEVKKAVVEVLRPNPRVPNLFRKDDNSRAERYRCNVTADEAVESMKRARVKEQNGK